MIGSLMYLTASRPDIMFAVCACSRYQITPKTSHLNAVKRIFMYLKGKPQLGLWYPRVSSFDLEACSYSDYVGANLDRKSTTRGCQFLGKRLISWQWKKQTILATSTTEGEYVAAANCCGKVLWIQNQMLDYGFNFMNTKIYIDNESTICIVKNLVFHSKTKHIEIRHHFIRDAYEKKLIQAALVKGRQVDLLYSLYEMFCEQKNLDNSDVFHRVIWVPESNWRELSMKIDGNAEFHEIMDFLTRSSIHYALTVSLVVFTTFVEQFWMSDNSKIINNVRYITATVAGKPVTISEASIRSDLLFDDVGGIDTLNNQAIFDTIQLMGFISVFLAKQLKNVPVPLDHFPINTLTSKVLSFMVKKGKNFSGNVTLLFDSMLVQLIEDESEASENHLNPNQYPLLLTQVKTNLSHSLTHLLDPLLLSLFLIPIQRVLVGIMEVTIQAKEIKELKAQLKKLKKKARPGRKTAKSKPTAHKDQAFDDAFDDLDALDYMETEDAHNEKGVSTKDQVSTVNPDEDENATPTATPIVFGDDETIAEFLVSLSQNKAKQKGVEIKDAEDADRPRPTSIRSMLTLKPLLKIDPKDKGKKVIMEEAESEAKSEGVDEAERKFAQLANDEEIARRVQEEWETKEEKKKLAKEEATKAALIRDYDDIQARIEADIILVAKLQENKVDKFTIEEICQVTLYINKKATGTKKDDSIKEERKEEETPDEDKEVDYEILDKKYPIIEWKTEYLRIKPRFHETKGLEEISLNVVIRSSGQRRYFSTLVKALSIFDRDDLNVVYQHQDWNVVSWKLHRSSVLHTLMTDEGLVIHMLVEKQYPLRKKVLVQMLELKLESKEDNTMALELIRFVKKLIAELEPKNSDGN
ncbi:hypothetical protein Tco_1195857 [Tanacetum coccineum]